MRVKNSDIEEGRPLASVPEVLRSNVQPGTILNISTLEVEPLTTQWLKHWFNTNVRTHLGEELCGYVPNGIMADGGQGTLGAAKRMTDGERLTTWTV